MQLLRTRLACGSPRCGGLFSLDQIALELDSSSSSASSHSISSNSSSRSSHSISSNSSSSNSSSSSSSASSSSSSAFKTPTNLAAPTINNKTVVGQTATIANGTWTHNPTGHDYGWQRSLDQVAWTQIPGEFAQTHVQDFDDIAHYIRGWEIATNAGGNSAPAYSNVIGPVTPV